jgi:hypothetical protein
MMPNENSARHEGRRSTSGEQGKHDNRRERREWQPRVDAEKHCDERNTTAEHG